MLKRTHTCGELSSQDIGKEIVLNGWVDRVRDLGGMLFVLVRDRYGKTQVYFDPAADKQLYESALKLGNEYTVGIKGIVNKRPEKDINSNMSTGEIEVMAKELVVFSESE
ncbi:MAG TPA: OB-fold nucleic acid binding domain-containing protein, partial [Petrotogaceae bacterium]|nr:OB-fold nucleic acid binding domain-containing protein [Petrotogaceae bacterium]